MKMEMREMTFSPQEGERVVEGYAAVLEQKTVMYSYDGVDYHEVIDRDAFRDADLSDVPFKYNHDNGSIIVARTRNKSLLLNVDDYGLKVRAEFADTTQGRDMYESIKSGLLDKMSFAFTVREQSYDTQTRTRRILKIDKVYDVSAVDFPAYDGTTLQARNVDTAETYFKEIIKEKETIKLRKRKLMLNCSL